MKKRVVALALCGALLIGGFSFWQSSAHAGATAFVPSHAHAGATTFVPTHKQRALQSSSGRSAYDPWARSYQPS